MLDVNIRLLLDVNIRLLTNDEVLHYENASDSECSDGEISEPGLKYYLQVYITNTIANLIWDLNKMLIHRKFVL